MKLWSGRFEKNTDKLVDSLNASISYDQRMYEEDITGSMAHAAMLGAQGIIPQSEADLIVKTLEEILEDCRAGKIEFSEENEDIHMNVEVLLTERIGAAGKRLYMAGTADAQRWPERRRRQHASTAYLFAYNHCQRCKRRGAAFDRG